MQGCAPSTGLQARFASVSADGRLCCLEQQQQHVGSVKGWTYSLQGTSWKRVYDADIPDSTGLPPLTLTFLEGTDPTGLMTAYSSEEMMQTYALSFAYGQQPIFCISLRSTLWVFVHQVFLVIGPLIEDGVDEAIGLHICMCAADWPTLAGLQPGRP